MMLSEALSPVGAPAVLAEAALSDRRRALRDGLRAALAQRTGDAAHYAPRGALPARCSSRRVAPATAMHCWGYPFDWVTRNGVMKAQTPLITTHALRATRHSRRCTRSTATSAGCRSCSRPPSTRSPTSRTACSRTTRRPRATTRHDTEGGVINASAYRAFLLISAAVQFSRARLPPGRRAQSQLRAARAASRRIMVLRDRRRPRLRRPLPHLLRPQGAGQDRGAGRTTRRCRKAIDAGVAYYVQAPLRRRRPAAAVCEWHHASPSTGTSSTTTPSASIWARCCAAASRSSTNGWTPRWPICWPAGGSPTARSARAS